MALHDPLAKEGGGWGTPGPRAAPFTVFLPGNEGVSGSQSDPTEHSRQSAETLDSLDNLLALTLPILDIFKSPVLRHTDLPSKPPTHRLLLLPCPHRHEEQDITTRDTPYRD